VRIPVEAIEQEDDPGTADGNDPPRDPAELPDDSG
jgi:hypothetical protein